jgi:rRNA processing protein Gar1
MGKFVHDCENEMFCESINTKIPYFNAPIYLENKVYIATTAAKGRIGLTYCRRLLEKSTKSWDR